MAHTPFPQRKVLRLKNYDYSQPAAYFATICTTAREHLFGEIQKTEPVGATLCGRPHRPDLMITKWLLAMKDRFPGVYIDCYAIMPDHIHFILVVTGDHTGSPLQKMIMWFKTMTTNEYIRNVKQGIYPPFSKSIWQRGYMEHIIRCESDLQQTRKYIQDNPLRWFYKWSE